MCMLVFYNKFSNFTHVFLVLVLVAPLTLVSQVQSNLSTMAALVTELTGHCGQVAVGGRLK